MKLRVTLIQVMSVCDTFYEPTYLIIIIIFITNFCVSGHGSKTKKPKATGPSPVQKSAKAIR